MTNLFNTKNGEVLSCPNKKPSEKTSFFASSVLVFFEYENIAVHNNGSNKC